MTGRADILIIGGDGQIGHAVAEAGPARGLTVLTTSRRETAGAMRLDLAEPPERWPILPAARIWVIAASVGDWTEIEADPERAERINAQAPAALAERAAAEGSRALLLSTSRVFDGSRARTPADAPPCPVTRYGVAKAAAEREVLARGGTVLRASKVLPPNDPRFAAWMASLSRGEPVAPFEDMVFAPVSLRLIVEAILALAASTAGGIHQLSADRDITYAGAVRWLADRHGWPASLIHPARATGNLPAALVPAHNTLDGTGLRAAAGIEPPDATDALATLLPPEAAAGDAFHG